MRFALVSDIHANLQAWNAVLEDIESLGITNILNLGDIVGYGPNPKEVLHSVREHAVASVIGNHDAVCAGQMDPSVFNDQARLAIEWTRQQLNEEECKYLQGIPEVATPANGGFLITHAEVVSPRNFGYILTAEDAVENFAICEDSIIFIGHTHRPGLFIQDEAGDVTLHEPGVFTCDPQKRYIINPGSVGDPRSEDIVASYCIYDSATREIEFRRIAFDIDAYRQAIESSGLETLPFFIRYLDAIVTGEVTLNIPSVGETDVGPQFDLSPQLPTVTKKSKRLPAITITIVTLVTAILLWVFIPRTDKDEAVAEAQPEASQQSAKTSNQSEPIADSTTEPPRAAAKKPAPSKASTLPNIPATEKAIMARYVKIVAAPGQPLVLAEVEVYSEKSNIARVKGVTQSSTRFKQSYASRAIDGNRNGKNPNSLAYTKTTTPAWWELDLGQDHRIDAVLIVNREASLPVMKRINGAYLILRNEKGEVVYRMPQRMNKSRVIKPRMVLPKK